MNKKDSSMIFKEKEYKILVEALKESNNLSIELALKSFITSDFKNKKIDDIDKIIETENYAKLPPTNSGYEKHLYKDSDNRDREQHNLNSWLYKLDKKIFKVVQDKFFKNGIDLCVDMQEELFKYEKYATPYYETPMSDRYVINSYQYVYYQLNNKTNYKTSPEAEKVFNDVTNIFVQRVRKEDHVFALDFIKKAIEANEDKDKVLSWFKTFLTTNKTISPKSKKHMDWIKEQIKDWDLTQHFKNNEINLLYSSNDGFIAKKVEGLFYEIDINLVKTKTKSTSDTVGKNIRLLISTLDEVLGNTDNYIKTTFAFNEPEVQFNILFKSGMQSNQIEAMNEIVKDIVNSKDKIKDSDMSHMIRVGLFAAFLEEKLDEKNTSARKAKI